MGALKTIWVLCLLVSTTLAQQTGLPDDDLNSKISEIFGDNVFGTQPFPTVPETTQQQIDTTIPYTNRPPNPTETDSLIPNDPQAPTTAVISTNHGEINVIIIVVIAVGAMTLLDSIFKCCVSSYVLTMTLCDRL